MTTDSNQGWPATFDAAPQQPAPPVDHQQWGVAMPPSIAPQPGATQDDVLVEPSYDGGPSTFSTMPQSTSLPPEPPARSAAEPAVVGPGDQSASVPSAEVTTPVTEGTVPVSGSTSPQDEPIVHGDAPARTRSADDERCLQTVQKVLQTTQDTASEITSVKETLNGLSKQFAKRLQYDDEKEAIIDRQHSELLKLREGLKDNLIQPVLYDVAETLDSVHKMRSKLESEAQQVDGMLEDV